MFRLYQSFLDVFKVRFLQLISYVSSVLGLGGICLVTRETRRRFLELQRFPCSCDLGKDMSPAPLVMEDLLPSPGEIARLIIDCGHGYELFASA